RAMRAKLNLKVRQPLQKIMVAVDAAKRESLTQMCDVILDEVNVKELIVLKDDSDIVTKSAKPNFKTLGPKFGKKVNPVANAIREFNKELIGKLEKGESVFVTLGEESFEVQKSDVEIISSEITGWSVESDEGVTVALDTQLNDDLIQEGLAREFVNRIQNMRKDAGFEVTDRILISVEAIDEFVNAIKLFNQYISNETLANKITFEVGEQGFSQSWEIGVHSISITIQKVLE
ncbi:MAG: DUF5915 domain-containing protein, partial [Ignavibacteria bacterium]|nr:DUF5915 domain-containing protein [Ignavibacteria bacterium]